VTFNHAPPTVGDLQVTAPRVVTNHADPASKTIFQEHTRLPRRRPDNTGGSQVGSGDSSLLAPPAGKSTSANLVRSLLDDDMPRIAIAPLQPLRQVSALLALEALSDPTELAVSVTYPNITTNNSSSHRLKASLTEELPAEKLEQTSELSTRECHMTTNQKAIRFSQEDQGARQHAENSGLCVPHPASHLAQSQHTDQPLALDPVPEFFTDIKANFRGLIQGLQGFPGEVVVQAEFGRIILRRINSRFITSEDILESFPSQELLDLLLPKPPKAGKQGITFFSNILTILPADMTYLVDLKNRDGEPMWEKKLAEWSIFYEISCHNEGLPGWHPFSIEIDGETFSTRIKTRYDFGALNVHGTRRHWDFRLVAFGFGDDEQNKVLYEDFASAIQSSLYIP
jgi:hypothetical protein